MLAEYFLFESKCYDYLQTTLEFSESEKYWIANRKNSCRKLVKKNISYTYLGLQPSYELNIIKHPSAGTST